MKIETNGGDWNPVQYGLTVNLSPDGKILSKSEMYVLRGENPKEIHRAFLELKRLIENGESKAKNESGENKPKKRTKKGTQIEDKQSEKDPQKTETCPKCGSLLVRKSGVSRNGYSYDFVGCSAWPACNFTKSVGEKEPLPIADQDLIEVEQVPF